MTPRDHPTMSIAGAMPTHGAAAHAAAPVRAMEILGNSVVGGMETYVTRFVAALPGDAWNVICVCPFESAVTRELRATGHKVFIAPVSDDPRWSTIHFVSTLVRRHDVRVIHAHLSNAHVLGALVGSVTGVPCVSTIHGRQAPMMDVEISRACGTELTVVSESSYWHALSLGIPADRLHYVRNGIDSTHYAPSRPSAAFRESLGFEPKHLLVGQVGRLAPEKGPEVFIRAAWLIHRKRPNVRFVLVGDGPLRSDLVAMVRDLGLEAVVRFAGLQPQMQEIYPSLDLLVSASHSEGMPFALMEGMACGLPVVATHVGGVGELVVSESTGLLVLPADPEGIASNAIKLLDDPGRRCAMGAAGRARIVDDFSFEASATQMAALLATVAARAQKASTPPGDAHGDGPPRAVVPIAM